MGFWTFRARLGGNHAHRHARATATDAGAEALSPSPGLGLVWVRVHLTKPHMILFESGVDTSYWILIRLLFIEAGAGYWVWAITRDQLDLGVQLE